MQNTSPAVMAQRHEPHDSLDDFPTPPWATRALVEKVLLPTRNYRAIKQHVVWEPSANRGHMVRPLREYFGRVIGSDIHDYGDHKRVVRDFLFDGSAPRFIEADGIDWIITNPPFRLAQQFVERGLVLKPKAGVAIIVRTAFLESVGRYNQLFRNRPPAIIAQFTERVPMVRGRLTETGSTATAYCWLVWQGARRSPSFVWIPPVGASLSARVIILWWPHELGHHHRQMEPVMPVTAAVLRELLRTGMTAEEVVEATERIERDEGAIKPRSVGAERTRRWRERHRDVTSVTPSQSVTKRHRRHRHM